MFQSLKNKGLGKKIFGTLTALATFVCVLSGNSIVALASQSIIDTQEVNKAANKIKDAVQAISMPVGAALVFMAVVMIAIKIIVAHGNPNRRSEAFGGLAWVMIGAILLGASLIVAGIIMKIAEQEPSANLNNPVGVVAYQDTKTMEEQIKIGNNEIVELPSV